MSSRSRTLPSTSHTKTSHGSRSGGSIRDRTAEVRRLQEIALAQLPRNGLFIVLYLRSDPPISSDFHWGLYLHTIAGDNAKGQKYHINNLSSGWITDHATTTGVFKSNFLVVLVQIATIPHERRAETDAIIRSKDNELNQIPGVSCRVWLMHILAMLRARALVKCNDLDALQEECFRIGNSHSQGTIKNEQPRPVERSKQCQP